MPEIPDLLYVRKYLDASVTGRTILQATVAQPVVMRTLLDRPISSVLPGKTINAILLRGPFLRFLLSHDIELIINLMLAGHLQHVHPGEPSAGYLCLSMALDDGTTLQVNDRERMAKIYLTSREQYGQIPRFAEQGIDVLSPEFTGEKLEEIAARHRRKQVRVFLNDHAILSAIGNAYADEILFAAGIHPKTLVSQLEGPDLRRLYAAIRSVLEWGILEVERAGAPIHKKVRDHLRVRNRKGKPCPRCGATIRREGVRGHDVFFCPRCQPPTHTHFIDWRNGPA